MKAVCLILLLFSSTAESEHWLGADWEQESKSPLSFNAQTSSMDKQWQSWLDSPPQNATKLAADLQGRANGIVSSIGAIPSILKNLDLVCSGGGDLNAYYLGMDMIFSRIPSINQHRRGGASGGGWITFEMALKGEQRTLQSYLSYGMLQEMFPISFSTIATTVLLQDHHWRMMAKWQAEKWNSTLSDLDGQVFLALDCGWTDSELKIVSEYTSVEQAASAFISTGAISQIYEGVLCADGSSESGPNMTPLFQDHARPQVIVNLMETGFPIQMGGGKYTSDQFYRLVQLGQDDAVDFIQTGSVARNKKAITLCPTDGRVRTNVCL